MDAELSGALPCPKLLSCIHSSHSRVPTRLGGANFEAGIETLKSTGANMLEANIGRSKQRSEQPSF